MKFSISKSDFMKALQIVSKGKSGRSTLPILSGIYICANDGILTFHSTDLEINVKHEVEALVEEPGETVVPGKLIQNIIKSLPEAAIQCTLLGEIFEISCMNSKFNVTTMNPKDFPSFVDLNCASTIELPAEPVSKMVRKVSKAISHDESHVILTGIYLQVDDSHLVMAATDSYRLAMAEMTLEGHEGRFDLVIPGSTFEDVCKLAVKEETLEIGYNDNQIRFTFGNSTLITRKIEGNYPNYRQIIPSEKTVTAVIERASFLDAVKRISIMAQEYMQIKLEIKPEIQQVIVSSRVADLGGAEEFLDAQIEGEEITIGFNYQYLMDGIDSIDSDEVIFEANKPLKPGVLKNVGEEQFLYLSMPVSISD